MLSGSTVEANVPAAELERARASSEGVLGLEPVLDVADTWVSYRVGPTFLSVSETASAGRAGHTTAQWHVDDVAAEVRARATSCAWTSCRPTGAPPGPELARLAAGEG